MFSVIINWDKKLLQEVQLKNIPLDTDLSESQAELDDELDEESGISESAKRDHELKEALKSVQISVCLIIPCLKLAQFLMKLIRTGIFQCRKG